MICAFESFDNPHMMIRIPMNLWVLDMMIRIPESFFVGFVHDHQIPYESIWVLMMMMMMIRIPMIFYELQRNSAAVRTFCLSYVLYNAGERCIYMAVSHLF